MPQHRPRTYDPPGVHHDEPADASALAATAVVDPETIVVQPAQVIQVGETASRMAAPTTTMTTTPAPQAGVVRELEEVLPSTLEYKDLGNNWSSLQQSGRTSANSSGRAARSSSAVTTAAPPEPDQPAHLPDISESPSDLEYKELGENMSYFIPRPDQVHDGNTASLADLTSPSRPPPNTKQRPSNRQASSDYPSNNTGSSSQRGGGWSKQTVILVGIVVFLTLVVGVLVGVVAAGGFDGGDGGGGDEDKSIETQSPVTSAPSPSPSETFEVVGITMRLLGGSSFSAASLAAFEQTLQTYYESIYEPATTGARRRLQTTIQITKFDTTVAVSDQQVDSLGNTITYDQTITLIPTRGQDDWSEEDVQDMLSTPMETPEGRDEFWNLLIQADANFAAVTQVEEPVMPLIQTLAPTTVSPTMMSSRPSLANAAQFPTVSPTLSSPPSQAETTELPTAEPVLIANITDIRLDTDDTTYVVEFTTNFSPNKTGGPDSFHVHFFFDTVGILNAGTPSNGPWILYDVPSPFAIYTTADRPLGATQLCITPATNNHAVVDTAVFHCRNLPVAATNAPTSEPTQAPFVTTRSPTARPSLRPTRAPTTRPTRDPTNQPTNEPTPDAPPPGVLTATITGITLENGAYQVSCTSNFEPLIDGGPDAHHLHFYFDTVGVANAGRPASGPWRLYDVPSPFTEYGPSDRPLGATQMCVTPATNAHQVDNPNFWHCVDLP